MPTNVSTPIWQCDICRTRFDANQAAAQRCEAAGLPLVLPPGSLMLDYVSDGYSRQAGFVLRRLYPLEGRLGTRASKYNEDSGHTVPYVIDLNPDDYRGADGVYRWPTMSGPRMIDSAHLAPYAPGVLTVTIGSWMGHHRGYRGGGDYGWILDAVGLPRSTMNPDGDQHPAWVRPLTPEVRAVLDELNAWPRLIDRSPGARLWRDEWLVNTKLGAYALGKTRQGDRPPNKRRATWYLRCADQDLLSAEVNNLWRRWRGGASISDRCEPEPVDVPRPRLTSTRDHLTASKLSKHMRELVAATGVEWPARTNATAYANLLVETTLEYRMDTEDHLFAAARVIAVRGRKGGVGKSTVAAALARRLALSGRRVVLVDCDLTGPSQHLIHALGPVTVDTERAMVLPADTDVPGLRVFSPGQVFGPGAKDQWSDESVGQWLDFIGSSLDLADAELVVLDLPPGDSAVHSVITTHYRTRLDVEVHVTTGHRLALADTERDLATRSAPGTRYLLENLSRVRGRDGTGRESELRLHGLTADAPALAERSGTEWAGSLPWVGSVAELAESAEIRRLADSVSG